MLRRLAGCTSCCVTAGGRSRSLVGLAVLLFAAGGVRRIARCAVPFAMAAVVAGALPGIALADPFSPINPFFGAGLDQKQQQEANRKSPKAKTEREASRTRWIGLSASHSRALGRTTFPEAFAADLFNGERPGPGLKIAQYRGGGVAVAETSTGERLLVQSSAALRAQTPIGQMAPVDLSLRESTDTFSTMNSNADLRISKVPTAGTELLGRDVTIALQTARESTGTAADGRVFYADVDTDTDYVISPLPDGGEFSWLLRSPNAPERFVLDLKIPQGAKIRRAQTKNPIPGDPPGNLEIVDGDKVLGYIEAPRAYDADRMPVESDLVILDDSRVAMTVEHHGRDLRYPLLADPEVTVHNDSSRGWTGWRNWYTHGSNWNANTNHYGFALFDPAYNPNGVYLSMPTRTYFWPQGTGINWGYHAPVDSYVYRTILGSIGHSPMPSWYAYGYLFSHIYSGILNPAANNWEAGQSWLSNYGSGAQGIFGPYGYSIGNLELDHCFEVRCNRAVGSDQNQAVFGLAAINNYNSNNIYTGDEKATGTMGYAIVFLGDRHNPWMRSDAQPPNRDWSSDSANLTHTLPGVTAEDRGLGVYGITLAGAASGNGTLRPSCDGNPNGNYCPKAWTTSGFSYQLNEGVTGLSLTPTDIVDNVGAAQTWTEKIDRSAPTITNVSGSLYDRRGNVIRTTDRQLRVTATDGDASSASTSRSGVRSIEILVDGVRATSGYSEQSCPQSSCPLSFDFTLANDLPEGTHTIQVVAKDHVGLVARSTPFDVIIDRTPPTLDVSGALKDKADQTLTEGFWTMDASATDESAVRATAGVRNIEITVDGNRLTVDGDPRGLIDQPGDCSGGGCPLEYDEIPYYTHEYATGQRTIRVRAEDYAGNTTTQQFNVMNSNNRPAAEAQAQASSPPFQVYHVGSILETLKMNEAVRQHIATDPAAPEIGRRDNVTYLYGECPTLSASEIESEGGCLPPIEVQSTPLCEKHVGLYLDPELGAWEYESKTIKGVPAASFDGGRILEIYTGTTTITIYGDDALQVLRFADALRLSVAENIPVLGQTLKSLVDGLEALPLAILPPPDESILAQTEPCT